MLPTSLLVLLTSIGAVRSSSLPDDAASSGVQIEHTNPVTCSRPTKSGDRISVHYRGRLQSNNVEFDESYKRGKPITFTLGAGEVIKGWDQGLLDMCPGEGRTLTIPPELAYGDRGTGPIPPHSTLIFTTELVDIQGVTQEKLTVTPTAWTFDSNGKMTTETAPATPPTGDEKEVAGLAGEPLHPEQSDVSPEEAGEKKPEKKECQLLGPFALLVQGALGTVAILTLVWKRYREVPKRPWKIFIFDVSKQVLGSILTHIVNLAMSMTGSMAIINAAQKAAEGHAAAAAKHGDVRMPNPCSFYLLNLGMDTTIGIFILYILLKVLHALFLRTPLARPPQSLTSGNYDSPPRWEWWAKQLLIYCIGLLGMKLCVFFLFQALPWLPWVGDWALRWTKGNEALEITFAMFVFPLAMNAVQYWVIDNLIKGRENKEKSGFSDAEYERVQGQEDDDEGGDGRFMNDSFSGGHQHGHDERSKGLEEVNPTPIPAYEEEEPLQSRHKRGESSQ